jgi:redox-sensing transcriptional repressor
VKVVPHRTVGRLSLYRRILNEFASGKLPHVHSHVLAAKAGLTAAQVRRDLMVIGYTGTPYHGYDVDKLRHHIESFLFPEAEQKVALAGVGNMGRAILAFFSGRRPKLRIVASFEKDSDKFNRVIAGCPCYPIEEAGTVIHDMGITIGVIAVPSDEAQHVATTFVNAGIRGILNFARTALRTPQHVFMENIDLAMSMDKVAFYARQSRTSREEQQTTKESNS